MMNKKEQAQLADALKRAAEYRALSWPMEEQPKPMTYGEIEARRKESASGLVTGWFINHHDVCQYLHGTPRVRFGCTNGHAHSRDRVDKTDTQGGGEIYETRSKALLALKWKVLNHFAPGLAKIDALIAEQRLTDNA